jgi:hypothetical protein
MGSIPDALAKIAQSLSSAPGIVNAKVVGTAIQRHDEKEKLKAFVAQLIKRWKRFI